MAKRTKKRVVTGVTPTQADQAFADFAIADAGIAKINADLDVQITRIREKKAEELKELETKRSKAFDVVQVYATENMEVLFPKNKSVDTVHGRYGFRTSTPKLKTLKGFTWNAVTNLLKEFLPDYVRTVEEPAKDMLLIARDDESVSKNFAKCGIEVAQDETFYIERKTEETEA